MRRFRGMTLLLTVVTALVPMATTLGATCLACPAASTPWMSRATASQTHVACNEQTNHGPRLAAGCCCGLRAVAYTAESQAATQWLPKLAATPLSATRTDRAMAIQNQGAAVRDTRAFLHRDLLSLNSVLLI